MLRAVLVGILSVCASGACGGNEDARAVPAGTAAGKVVDVTGSVQATRDGTARPLAKDAEVFADDVVSTTGGGSVVIELFHNHARWSVESGRTGRVDASLAWGLSKQQASAPVDHATAAAGRNAERSAADTHATAAAEAIPAPPAAEPAAQPPTADEAKPEPRSPRAEPPTRAAPRPAADLPPPPPPPPKPTRERAVTGAPGGGAPTSPSPDATEGLGSIGTPRQGGSSGGAGAGGGGGGKATAAPTKAKAAATPTELLARQRAAFAACLDDATPKVKLAVIVRDGAARFVVSGGSDEVRACIERVGKRIEFATDGRATLEIAK